MTITKSEQAPLVVVVGATGNQGGSVLQHLIESDKEYRIRALTRDASKPKVKKIESTGAEVFEIDLKPENKERMLEAFSGANVVFAVTNYWEHLDGLRETAEGKAMVDRAIEAKVELFIFAGLPGPSMLSNGKHTKVQHFDSKAIVDDYGRSKISNSFNYRTVQAGFFYSGLQGTDSLNFFTKAEDGSFFMNLPVSAEMANRTPLPLVDIPGDFGLWVRAIIERKEVREDSRPVLCQSDALKMDELTKALQEVTGKEFKIKNLTHEEYAATFPPQMPSFVVDDLVDQWEFDFDMGYWGGQDVHWAEQYLVRKPTPLAAWLKKVDLSYYTK